MIPPGLIELEAFTVLEVMEHTAEDQAAECIGQNIGGIVQVFACENRILERVVGRVVMLLHNVEMILFFNQIVALPDSIVEQVSCRFFHIKDVVKLTDFLCIENGKILAAHIDIAEIIGFPGRFGRGRSRGIVNARFCR